MKYCLFGLPEMVDWKMLKLIGIDNRSCVVVCCFCIAVLELKRVLLLMGCIFRICYIVISIVTFFKKNIQQNFAT